MIRIHSCAARRGQTGVTLIELMIAMVLGLLVTAGIITVFVNTSRSNQVQSQMARLQENGRFAVGQLTDALRMANAGFCSNSGGAAKATSVSGAIPMDGLRSPTVLARNLTFADDTTAWGTGSYPASPTSAYSLPSYLYMRGYDCDAAGTCKPLDPHDIVADIPEQGTTVGSRVVGSDVLTMRHLDNAMGWRIGPDDDVATSGVGFTVSGFTIVPSTNEPKLNTIAANDRFLYGDCSSSYVFAGTAAGGDITVLPNGAGQPNMATFAVASSNVPAWLFDFTNAFKTVTWYLQVVDDDSVTGHKTGALMRRVNGQAAEEVVRGVERLDFRYGVQDLAGKIRFLTADEIDSGVSGVACPVQAPDAPGEKHDAKGHRIDIGCLWRAVRSIEVSMLVDGQQPMNSLEPSALAYSYSGDVDAGDALTPEPPDDASHKVKYSDQGFERGLLRREFNALVSVRNFNP